MIKRFILFMLLAGSLYMQGQSRWLFETGVGSGYSLAHHVEMNHLTHRFIPSFQFSMEKTTFHLPSAWARAYHYPEWGFGLTYQDFSDDRLGQVISITFNTKVRLNSYQRKTGIYFMFNGGIGWVTRPYHPIENFKNNILGTHLNNAYIFGPVIRFPIHHQWKLNAGVLMYHYSNGSFKKPNLGINIPVLYVALRQSSAKPPDSLVKKFRITFQKKRFLSLYTKGGWAEKNLELGGGFVGTLGMQINWHPVYKHIFSAGMEWMDDRSMKRFVKYRAMAFQHYGGFKVPDYHRAGIYVGHAYYFDRFQILTDFGYYIYDKTEAFIPMYYRIGVRYALAPKWLVSFDLKLHLVEAEYLSIGIHRKFNF